MDITSHLSKMPFEKFVELVKELYSREINDELFQLELEWNSIKFFKNRSSGKIFDYYMVVLDAKITNPDLIKGLGVVQKNYDRNYDLNPKSLVVIDQGNNSNFVQEIFQGNYYLGYKSIDWVNEKLEQSKTLFSKYIENEIYTSEEKNILQTDNLKSSGFEATGIGSVRQSIYDLETRDFEKLVLGLVRNEFDIEIRSYKSEEFPDLFQYYNENNQVEIVVSILEDREISYMLLNKISAQVIRKVNKIKPKYFILVSQTLEGASFIGKIVPNIKNTNTKFVHYGIDWIVEKLNNNNAETSTISFIQNDLQDSLKHAKELKNENLEKFSAIIDSERRIYALSNIIDGVDHFDKFIQNKEWHSGNKEKRTSVVKQLKPKDIVFVFSVNANDSILKSVGVIKSIVNEKININWNVFKKQKIPIPITFKGPISKLRTSQRIDLLERVSIQVPDIYYIISKLDKRGDLIFDKNDIEFFKDKYNTIIEEPDFYFQKAKGILNDLINYEKNINLLSEKEKSVLKSNSSLYIQLQHHWRTRGEVKPSKFSIHLKKIKQPGLIPVYELICKFLSYVDYNSWNKKNFNDYKDKRTLARTGLYQSQLITHFLDFAINDFVIKDDGKIKVFDNAIRYLKTPGYNLNVLSQKHQELISQFLFGRQLLNDAFHNETRNYFDKIFLKDLKISNLNNTTYFYMRVLYDERIKKLWFEDNLQDDENGESIEGQKEKNSDIDIVNGLTKTFLENDGAYSTKDLLDIENDVRAFALILASKDIKPPLAIAIFGVWGSGKSFFMEHLSKRVDELSIHQGFLENGEKSDNSENDSADSFCKGIAQIKFNAWSYLDSNLWAGLVSSIFEKLDEYISDSGKGEEEKIKLRQKLSDKLEILSTEKREINKEKKELNIEKEDLKKELGIVKEQKGEMIKDFHKKNLSKLLNKLNIEFQNEINKNTNLKSELNEYGVSDDRIEKLNPIELYSQVSSGYTFIQDLLRFSWKQWVLFIISFGILVFVWIDPFNLTTQFFENIGREITAVFSVLIPLISKSYQSFVKYMKVISPIIDSKNLYEYRVKEVKFEFERGIEFLEKKILEKQKEIDSIILKLNEIENEIEDIDFTIKNFITQRAFNSFIARKAKGKEYDKHLGLISIIRKDFETLSDLFFDVRIDNEASIAMQKAQKEKSKDYKEIVKLFKKDKALNRIILYIDDLDRCSDKKVLEVIQAVHLLMAFPLFNVVVGVDRRCVNNAIIHKDFIQYPNLRSRNEIIESGIHLISPEEYLEKIFQIPFRLSNPSNNNIKGMVDTFLSDQIIDDIEDDIMQEEISVQEDDIMEINEEIQSHDSQYEREASSVYSDMIAGSADKQDVNLINETQGFSISNAEVDKEDKAEEIYHTIKPKDLKLTKDELELMREMIDIVGVIPRTIKRYINIYRIIRSHQDFSYNQDERREEFIVIMFLLALNIGKHKDKINNIESLLSNNANEGKKLKDILVDRQIGDVVNELSSASIRDELIEIEISRLLKHVAFIGKFSFGIIEQNKLEE